jgi:hypothetical protein
MRFRQVPHILGACDRRILLDRVPKHDTLSIGTIAIVLRHNQDGAWMEEVERCSGIWSGH